MTFLERLHGLNTRLTEFGLSFTTTKRVLGDLRKQAGNVARVRPSPKPWPVSGKYDPVSHEISVPRGQSYPDWNSPTVTSLHEHGHAADPVMGRIPLAREQAYRISGEKFKAGDYGQLQRFHDRNQRVTFATERRANQRVLRSIQKHGTPEEVQSWRKTANTQMKVGYRKPIFDDLVSERGDSLRAKKEILRSLPHLRSKFTNLSRKLENA